MTLLSTKIAAARAVGSVVRRAGRGGGTSLPGKVLLALEPHAISELAARLPRGSVVVSTTNGKTTTAAMVASVLDRAGVPVVHNRAGANMAGGVASTLLAAARSGDRIDGELGLFEVDEFWLDRIAPQLEPRGILLGNLFRDQLEPRTACSVQRDLLGGHGRLGSLAPTRRAAVHAQVAEVDHVVDVGRSAPPAVLGVRGVLHLGDRHRRVLDPEVRDVRRVAPQVSDQRIVRVQHDPCVAASRAGSHRGPAIGDRVELAIAIELVSEQIAEQDPTWLELRRDPVQPELVDLE